MAKNYGPLIAEHMDLYTRLEAQIETNPEYVRDAAGRGRRQLLALVPDDVADEVMIEAGRVVRGTRCPG